MLVKSKTDFPKTYIKKLVKEAYANSLAKVRDKTEIVKGRTIVKSISEKKRERPRKKDQETRTKKMQNAK